MEQEQIPNSTMKLKAYLSLFLRFVTQEPKAGWAKLGFYFGLLALYLGGLWALFYLLEGGAIQMNLHDWAEVTGHRYAFLKDAVTKGELPLHMPGEWGLRNVTDRFIAIPDTNLGPQIFLLRYLEVGRFILFNTLLLYSVGFVGLVMLAKRLRLSLLSFSLLFGLMFFNGHIISHMVVGHVNWAANFLFPFFGYLVIRLMDGWDDVRWVAAMAIFMFALVLQGAFHFFVACVLFLILIWIFQPRTRRPILIAGLFTAGLGAIRFLPPLLELREFDTAFLSGYPTALDLVEGMIVLKPPIPEYIFTESGLTNLNWWEFDLYLGLVGTIFLVAFGAFSLGLSKEQDAPYKGLGLPILLMTVLSIGKIYKLLALTQIPILTSQRVSSRLIFVPFAMLLILATDSLQRWLNRPDINLAKLGAAATAAVIVGHDLWQHTKLWRVSNMDQLFPPKDVNLALNIVANHPDPAYQTLLLVGAATTGISLLTLIGLLWRDRRRQAEHP